MNRRFYILGWALACILAACGEGSQGGPDGATTTDTTDAKPAAPTALEYASAFDMSRHDLQVAMEGYLQLPNMMYTSGDDAQVDFHARPLQRYGEEIIANIHTGDCNNCMAKLGEKYQLSDLRLRTADGAEVRANERVRLTGRLRVHESSMNDNGLSVALDVAKIEKIPEIDLDYSKLEVVELSKENLLDTTLRYRLSMAQGKIEIPTMLFMENDVTLDMKIAGTRIGVNFSFGTGPNQIEPIPSNYTKDDFKIHNAMGELVNLNKPVKVWGTRSTPTSAPESAGVLYVERIQQ